MLGPPLYAFRIDADDYIGFVPSPPRVVRRMLELAEIKRGDVVYDLGCGDGRVLISAARKYGARGVGIDIDPERLKQATQRARRFQNRIAFQCRSVFKVDLRDADVVTIYLLPDLNRKLMRQLAKLKPGCRIVTHAFPLPDIKEQKKAHLTASDGLCHDIYLYRTPLQRL
jgi:SAM-dependent methyltransferase